MIIVLLREWEIWNLKFYLYQKKLGNYNENMDYFKKKKERIISIKTQKIIKLYICKIGEI